MIFRYARELNAFAIGEDNARHIGVNVRRVKLVILITVSVMIGVCVSIGGSIGFVGLVVPHMARMIAGPNHRRLLPASMFSGAIFLLLADLIARTLLSPVSIAGMGDTAVEEILGRDGWGDISAVKNGSVYNADSNAISRPGPRLKDAAIELYDFINGVEAEEAPAA